MILPIAVTKRQQINAAVSEVVKEMYPAVQHIRYDIGQDWGGQWAIFFRVLLSDEASTEGTLREVAPQVVRRMSDELDLPNLGLFPYFDFRSQAEQREIPEPAWA